MITKLAHPLGIKHSLKNPGTNTVQVPSEVDLILAHVKVANMDDRKRRLPGSPFRLHMDLRCSWRRTSGIEERRRYSAVSVGGTKQREKKVNLLKRRRSQDVRLP